MDLLKEYHAVNTILDTIDFDALFHGFHKYRFALYSSREIILDGKIIPYQEEFRGNTAKLYEGEYIAIWNMEFDPVEDPEYLASCLVHEMFHCHQRTNHETRYPSDLELLSYPDDTENFVKKYNENRYLADAYALRDRMLLRKFASVRESRHGVYPAMVRQEWKVETLEGMAEYVGLKALQRINADKYHAVVEDYLGKLRAENKLLFDVRRISYYSGAVYFLCLERFGFPVHNVFDCEQTAYEQNPIDIAGVIAEVLPCEFVLHSHREFVQEKREKVSQYIEHAEYTACRAAICGYDPMNMFRIDDMIYCSHFIFLDKDGKDIRINSPVVLRLEKGSNVDVVGYYLSF